MTCLIHLGMAHYSNVTAIIDGKISYTYKALNERISTLDNSLGLNYLSPSGNLMDLFIILSSFRHRQPLFLLNSKLPDLVKAQYLNGVKNAVLSENIATLMLTSGSSGLPKIALHSFDQYRLNASGALHNMPLIPGDRWLLSLPLYHVGGLGILFRCFLSGAAVVLRDSQMEFLDQLIRDQITHVSMVGAQFKRLVERCESDQIFLNRLLKHLCVVLLGGGPVPMMLITRGRDLKIPLCTTYGLTEMTSQVTATPMDADIDDFSTGGFLLAERELKIVNDEIWVKGPTLFLGYLSDSGSPKSTLDESGWFCTGDMGHLDTFGRLVVVGRKDRLFISGGENIYPEEIESILLSLSDVYRVFVSSLPDETYGFRPIAYIDTPLSEDFLKGYLKERLPSYKIPLSFFSWESLDVKFKDHQQRGARSFPATWKNSV